MKTQITLMTNDRVAVEKLMKSVYDGVVDFYLLEENYQDIINGDELAEQYADEFVSDCYRAAGADHSLRNLVKVVGEVAEAQGITESFVLGEATTH